MEVCVSHNHNTMIGREELTLAYLAKLKFKLINKIILSNEIRIIKF